MDHEIDEMIFGSGMHKYKDFDFKSINHANALEELDDKDNKKDKKSTDVDDLIKKIKSFR